MVWDMAIENWDSWCNFHALPKTSIQHPAIPDPGYLPQLLFLLPNKAMATPTLQLLSCQRAGELLLQQLFLLPHSNSSCSHTTTTTSTSTSSSYCNYCKLLPQSFYIYMLIVATTLVLVLVLVMLPPSKSPTFSAALALAWGAIICSACSCCISTQESYHQSVV